MSRKRNKARFRLHHLHRWFGVIAAAFALNLAATGILLNHTEAFQLDSTELTNPQLLNWYGIDAPETGPAFQLAERWLSQQGDQLRWDAERLSVKRPERLLGAIFSNEIIIALFPTSLDLLSQSGELIDVMPLPEGQVAVAIAPYPAGGAFVKTDKGILALDASLSRFESVSEPAGDFEWREPKTLPDSLSLRVQTDAGGKVSLERVILDLHSGRLFGVFGVWLMDLAAIAIAVLALSGVAMWMRRTGKAKRRQR